MPVIETQEISLHYELLGDVHNPPALLLAGLGGSGKTWGPVVERFAKEYFVILPDQRGTGMSSRPESGYSTAQIATDMASLVAELNVGACHVVGSSTGGAIAQMMALDHPQTVRSLTLASSFARFDSFMTREFTIRRKMVAESDTETVHSLYSLFLFSPRYARQHPERVEAWVAKAASVPPERKVSLKRIDMVMRHDALSRLAAIYQPTLVMCGDHDFCTPVQSSEELAKAIPGAELVVLSGAGHMAHLEQEDLFFSTVHDFTKSH